MTRYAQICGGILARAHARSGDRIAIGSYLGGGDSFDEAMAEFAAAYADQNERDYAALEDAVADGRLEPGRRPEGPLSVNAQRKRHHGFTTKGRDEHDRAPGRPRRPRRQQPRPVERTGLPHEIFARLRAEEPLHWSELGDFRGVGLLVGGALRGHRRRRPRPRDLLLGPQHHPRRQARARARRAGSDGSQREHDDHPGSAAPRPAQGTGAAGVHAEARARAHRADARDHQPASGTGRSRRTPTGGSTWSRTSASTSRRW